MREVNFDGLCGPTHNYGGLSPGNVASMTHGGDRSSPKAAALQGLAKMRFVRELGVPAALLPPQPRPSLRFLRSIGFRGGDDDVIRQAAQGDGHALRVASSAAAMWTANAATVAPSPDTADQRLHIVPANLNFMVHRAIEAETTHAVLRAIFADSERFAVHAPLPAVAQFADEGAANHTRLHVPGRPAVHLLAWGRRGFGGGPAPLRFPARQTFAASEALARLLRLDPEHTLLPQQHPDGIDAGAFHTDVLAVGDGDLLLVHELAFADLDGVLEALRRRLGDAFKAVIAREADLPVADAVAAYPFNSQLLTTASGSKVIVAPEESRENPRALDYLSRVQADGHVDAVHYLDLRQSMRNGGGPACLRLRVVLSDEERAAIGARVFVDDALLADLSAWVERSYRDALDSADLADPLLARESMTALDELTRILRLGSVYDFQRE